MLPIQITIRDIANANESQALENHIRKKAEKVSRFYRRINSCRVVITVPRKHPHQGKLFNARIDMTVPGKEFAVTHQLNEDAYVAVNDAFDALTRQLEDYSHMRHGDVKTHERTSRGHIKRLFADEGYGFIQGVDNNEYYFSVTNVAHTRFDQLMVGDAVEFLGIPASDGLQAQRVTRID